MKRNLMIVLISLIAISCGKKSEPDQTYIAIDEKSSTQSNSLDKSLDKNIQTSSLKGVGFFEDTCDTNNIQRDVLIFREKIETLGGQVLGLENYEEGVIGLTKFLRDSGLMDINAVDFADAGTKSKMTKCKVKDLVPPKSCWYRTLTFGLLMEKIEVETGVKTKLTSHYRNKCYNKLVKGKSRSDHIAAKAVDISLGSQENRYKVEQFICNQMWKENYFLGTSDKSSMSNISIGLGKTFIHLGIDSVHGRRHWLYDKYLNDNNMPQTCWIPKS